MKIPNKEAETLVTVVDQLWMQIHGPPKELIMDGEAGIQLSHSSQQAFMEKGVKLHMRAKNMHARYIERRGELFREAIHKIVTDLEKRHLDITAERIIAEAVFCGNALLSTNGSTPYNNVYGRVPHILPGIDDITLPGKPPNGHFLREAHLLRDVSVQATIEGSARARLLRSEHTKTTVSAAKLNLQLGELVDFYREPSTKDVSGWYGPAKIVDLDNQTRGIVSVRYLRNIYEVAIRHLRKHLIYWVFHAAPDMALHPTYRTVWQELRTLATNLPQRMTYHVGRKRPKDIGPITRTL